MPTVTLVPISAKHSYAAVPSRAPEPAGRDGQGAQPGLVVAVIIAVVMVISTMRLLGRAFGPVLELFRMAVAALAAALLLGCATVALVLALVLSVT